LERQIKSINISIDEDIQETTDIKVLNTNLSFFLDFENI
jgi:hypothetical protein